MEVEFDPEKRALAFQHRGLDFARAEAVFEGFHFTIEDVRRDYGEARFQTVGSLDGQVVMVVWTLRGAVRRIISMRRCHAPVAADYEKRRLGRSG